MRYGKLERFIARLLEPFPGMRRSLKFNYQKLMYFLNRKDYSMKTKYPIRKFSYKNKESFFGYYDKSPIDSKNRFVIFHTSLVPTNCPPDPKIPIKITLCDLLNNEMRVVDESYAYNWQQGSRLMWLSEGEFIYNVFEDGDFKAKIYNLNEGSTKVLPLPIYDCFKDQFAISLNFERLCMWRKDYCYLNKGEFQDWANLDDGLYWLNLKTCEYKKLISFKDVIDLHFNEGMRDAKHKFNHVMISPSGKSAVFIHRWLTKNGRKYDALCYITFDRNSIKVIADWGMVSHYCWISDSELFVYMRGPKGDGYYFLNVETGVMRYVDLLSDLGDGHPSYFCDRIVLDTYPNKSRFLELFLFNLTTGNLLKLGEFFQSFDYYGESRCDLHPRFSFDGRKIFFDSVHEGKRYLYMMELCDEE